MAERLDEFGRPRPLIAAAKTAADKRVLVLGISDPNLDHLRKGGTLNMVLDPFGVDSHLIVMGGRDYDDMISTLRAGEAASVGYQGQPESADPKTFDADHFSGVANGIKGLLASGILPKSAESEWITLRRAQTILEEHARRLTKKP